MFEHISEPVLHRAAFFRRFARSAGLGLSIIAASLFVGMACYHSIEGLGWLDSFLNAAMLLGGMGPLEHQRNSAGKFFEGIYAMYCGLAVISVAGIIFAPVLHRFLHKIHQQQQMNRKNP